MTFEHSYRALARKFARRDLRPGDGVDERDLIAAEERLGVRLPAALRVFYRAVGHAPDLARVHNRLLAPSEIAADGRHLVFMEENQSVVSWGFRLADLAKEDPVVWQRNNTPPVEWFSERKRFSRFMEAMFSWYAGMGVWTESGGPPHGGGGSPSGLPLERASVEVEIVRVDAAFPGWVECRLIDAHGDVHWFHEKVPIVSAAHLDAAGPHPARGLIRCSLIGRHRDAGGKDLIVVDTRAPDDVESRDGVTRFDVLPGTVFGDDGGSPSSTGGRSSRARRA